MTELQIPEDIMQQLRAEGYELDNLNEYVAGVKKAPKETPVAVLEIQGKFNGNIFTEEVQHRTWSSSCRTCSRRRRWRWASTSSSTRTTASTP